MEIQVLSRLMTRKLRTEEQTLLIGILDSKHPVPVDFLNHSEKVTYKTYVFDDIEEHYKDYILLDKNIAREIVLDFHKHSKNKKILAVHCREGISRSPAIAAALNDSFNLGFDQRYLSQFYGMNKYVYNLVLKEGIKWRQERKRQ